MDMINDLHMIIYRWEWYYQDTEHVITWDNSWCDLAAGVEVSFYSVYLIH